MAILTIASVKVKDPKVFQVDIQDIDKESERNANGTMQRTRVAVKRKLTIEWGPLRFEDSSAILKAVENVFFDVTYPDPKLGKTTTKTFYVGDRSAPMYSMINGIAKWEGLKMNFIEK